MHFCALSSSPSQFLGTSKLLSPVSPLRCQRKPELDKSQNGGDKFCCKSEERSRNRVGFHSECTGDKWGCRSNEQETRAYKILWGSIETLSLSLPPSFSPTLHPSIPPSLPLSLPLFFSISPPPSLCNPCPMHVCTWFFCVWYGTLGKPTYQDSLEESSEEIICTTLGEKWEFWSDIDGDQGIKVGDSYWTALAALCTKIGFHKAVHTRV